MHARARQIDNRLHSFVCDRGDCRRGFENKGKMLKHLRIHDNLQEKCPFCPWNGDSYKKSLHLNHHFRIRPFSCSFCEKKFFTKPEVKMHEEILHERIKNRYKCAQCDFVTHARNRFSEHKRIHYPEMTQ